MLDSISTTVWMATRRLLAALVLAGCGVVVLGAQPAMACSCVTATTQEHTMNASDVFSGKVTGHETSGGKTVYDVDVDRVFKGEVATAQVQVESAASGASCGLERIMSDKPYVFFADRSSSTLKADLCGGTARASDQLVKQVERLLGDGHAPTPATPKAATFTRVAHAEPQTLPRLAAPGIALVLAGLLGLLVVRRVGARS